MYAGGGEVAGDGGGEEGPPRRRDGRFEVGGTDMTGAGSRTICLWTGETVGRADRVFVFVRIGEPAAGGGDEEVRTGGVNVKGPCPRDVPWMWPVLIAANWPKIECIWWDGAGDGAK